MNTYGIRPDYQVRLRPQYFHDEQRDGKRWQPDVYPLAAHLARIFHCKRLIDLGCGHGNNLAPYSREFDILGVDYGANIRYCQSAWRFGTWVECDLESRMPDLSPDICREAVIICADVVEHLADPQWLFLTIMQSLCCAPLAIVSTPDRARVYGYDHDGPPRNPHHVREWTLKEWTSLMPHIGLRIAWAGWTVSNDVDRLKNTLLTVLTRRDKAYRVQFDGLFDVEQSA